MKLGIRKGEKWALVIIAVSFLAGILFYPLLPPSVPSHWNASGDVNGYLPRFWGAFLMPFLGLALLALFMVVPRIDPKRENIEKFRGAFDDFILLVFTFLAYLHTLTLFWGIGYTVNIPQWLSPALAVLFYATGSLIGKAEPNWTIGIRTPWTLSSESVWRRTHALGAKLFHVSGIIALVGVVFPAVTFPLVIVPVVASAVALVVYSYIIFSREKTVL